MSEITLDQGDSQILVGKSDPTGDYEIKVDGGHLSLATRRTDAIERDDRVLEPGRPARLTKNENVEKIWAYAYEAPVTVRISKTHFRLVKSAPQSDIQVSGLTSVSSIDTLQNQPAVEALLGNGTGVSTISQDVSAASNLPPMAVPDGFNLLLRADPTNDDDVLIDGSFPLGPGDSLSLRVSDASQVSVTPASGTQTVHAISEAP